MVLIVVPRLPFRAAALPASTGIETFSIMRINLPSFERGGLYTRAEPSATFNKDGLANLDKLSREYIAKLVYLIDNREEFRHNGVVLSNAKETKAWRHRRR